MTVETADLKEYLDFRGAFSSVALPQLVAEEAKYNLIYIDGSHLFEDAFVDFYYATQLLADGGVVVFDDCADPHVQKILKFIRSNYSTVYEPFDLAPYRSDKGKTARYRLAKIVNKIQVTAFRKTGSLSTRVWTSLFVDF